MIDIRIHSDKNIFSGCTGTVIPRRSELLARDIGERLIAEALAEGGVVQGIVVTAAFNGFDIEQVWNHLASLAPTAVRFPA
jgi:hypothetical protein